MSLPIVEPGTFIHSPELGIEVTTFKTRGVRVAPETSLCDRCVFQSDKHDRDTTLCDNQSCHGVIFVDRRTYALLRLTR